MVLKFRKLFMVFRNYFGRVKSKVMLIFYLRKRIGIIIL